MGSDNEILHGDSSRLVKKKPALTLSSSTKKVKSGTSSFLSAGVPSASSSSSAAIKKKKSISGRASTSVLGGGDHEQDGQSPPLSVKSSLVSSSSSITSKSIKIPKTSKARAEEVVQQESIKPEKKIRKEKAGERKSLSYSAKNLDSDDDDLQVKEKVSLKKAKKKRAKSLPGSTIEQESESPETMEVESPPQSLDDSIDAKLKSSNLSKAQQKSLRRKSIEGGNIFQIDQKIEEAKHMTEEDLESEEKEKEIKKNKIKKTRLSTNETGEKPKKLSSAKKSSRKSHPSVQELPKESNIDSFNNYPIQQQPIVHFQEPHHHIVQQPTSKTSTTVYPKTPMPIKEKKQISKPDDSFRPSHGGAGAGFIPSTPMSSFNQHAYPQSPDGFQYNSETPSPYIASKRHNLSFLTPSEGNISFDTDDNLIDDQTHQNTQFNRRILEEDTIGRMKKEVEEKEEDYLFFKYLLVVVSFAFWAWTLFTVFNFFYHLNDVRYCDTGRLPRYDINGKLDCQLCPENAICQDGSFIRCQTDYVERYGKNYLECILDPSKVKGMVTVINDIDNILREHKGNHECGHCLTESLEIEELKTLLLSRYWLNKDQAEVSYNNIIDYIVNHKNTEEIGIDKRLVKTIESKREEDGKYYLYSTDEPILPLYCQIYLFLKHQIKNIIPYLLVVLALYGGYLGHKHQKSKLAVESLFVDQSYKKLLRNLQQRKVAYEEPWVSELILREEVLGAKAKEEKKWKLIMDLVYKNNRILVTAKEVNGETISTLEYSDSNPTPRKGRASIQQLPIDDNFFDDLVVDESNF